MPESGREGNRDFFISYRTSDESWATWIAWQLEAAGYTTFIQSWDFQPSSNFVDQMQGSTTRSNRTLAVLTPAYLEESGFTKAEWYAAFAKDPTGKEGALLPVRVEACDVIGLLGQIVYVDLVGLNEAAARERLLAGVKGARAKPTVERPFPGAKPGYPLQPAPASAGGQPPPAHGPRRPWRTIIGIGAGLGLATVAGVLFYVFPAPPACKILPEPQHLATGTTFKDCTCCPSTMVLPNGTMMSQYEVTKGEYAAFRGEAAGRWLAFAAAAQDKCYVFKRQGDSGAFEADYKNWQDPGFYQTDDGPVVCVSWDDAKSYADWLSQKTSQLYRLPSLAEFDYATRAGGHSDVIWGSDPDDACRYANINDAQSVTKNGFPWQSVRCNDGYPRETAEGMMQTAPTDAPFMDNAFDMFHLVGNVYEWIGSGSNCGTAGQTGIWGGSWTSAPDKAKAISGWCQQKGFKAFDIGFRVVRVSP